jgi:hypothetical protein
MMDRSVVNINDSQMGFIEYLVAPLAIAVVTALPALQEIGKNTLSNFHSWSENRKRDFQDSADRDEECAKIDQRVAKFSERMRVIL